MGVASTVKSKSLESYLMFPKKVLRASQHITKNKKNHLLFTSGQHLQYIFIPIFEMKKLRLGESCPGCPNPGRLTSEVIL